MAVTVRGVRSGPRQGAMVVAVVKFILIPLAKCPFRVASPGRGIVHGMDGYSSRGTE